jgi:hypothetical protein
MHIFRTQLGCLAVKVADIFRTLCATWMYIFRTLCATRVSVSEVGWYFPHSTQMSVNEIGQSFVEFLFLCKIFWARCP